MILWRISNYATLDGIGGYKFSARWHTKGRPIVYAADHPASALLELLVHTERTLLPEFFKLLKIETPGDNKIERLSPPKDWQESLNVSRNIGDLWLASGKTLLLQVPSAILPDVFHTLINPKHSDAKHVRILSIQDVPVDPRLK